MERTMLIGILVGDSLVEYHAMTRNAPLPICAPLIAYLSSPSETVNQSLMSKLTEGNVTIQLRPTAFRHLFNPNNGDREFVAGFQWPQGIANRPKDIGVENPETDFVPYARLAIDGMRSRACRAFLRSFSNMMVEKDWTFQVAEARRDVEAHKPMFDLFNPEAGIELQFTQMHGIVD
jgi:hypothetical protein